MDITPAAAATAPLRRGSGGLCVRVTSTIAQFEDLGVQQDGDGAARQRPLCAITMTQQQHRFLVKLVPEAYSKPHPPALPIQERHERRESVHAAAISAQTTPSPAGSRHRGTHFTTTCVHAACLPLAPVLSTAHMHALLLSPEHALRHALKTQWHNICRYTVLTHAYACLLHARRALRQRRIALSAPTYLAALCRRNLMLSHQPVSHFCQ
jgi:hypothetical protein